MSSLPDVSEEQYFSANVGVSGNVISLSNVTVTYSASPITLRANILEQINVIINTGGVDPGNSTISFSGAYREIFTDKIIQYRKTGADPAVYQVFSFGAVENNLYALTRFRPDLRNELSVNYAFTTEVTDPETTLTSISNVIISQTLLNDYNRDIQLMLQKIASETKIKGQV